MPSGRDWYIRNGLRLRDSILHDAVGTLKRPEVVPRLSLRSGEPSRRRRARCKIPLSHRGRMRVRPAWTTRANAEATWPQNDGGDAERAGCETRAVRSALGRQTRRRLSTYPALSVFSRSDPALFPAFCQTQRRSLYAGFLARADRRTA